MPHEQPKDEVNIVIDKKHYKSPAMTTGAALYVLGQVKADHDLYRETKGKGDDELIPNDVTAVKLKDGDHFFTSQRSLNPGA